jgi:hypothetical protein
MMLPISNIEEQREADSPEWIAEKVSLGEHNQGKKHT